MVGVLFPSKFEAEEYLEALSAKTVRKIGDLWTCQGTLHGDKVIVAVIGIGTGPALQRTRTFLENFPCSAIVLAGFGGSLSPRLPKGSLVVASEVSSDDLINYIKLLPDFVIAKVHTSAKVVSGREAKLRLAQETGCQVVDMELAPIGALIREAGIEFLCLRVISDGVDDEVPHALLAKTYSATTGLPKSKFVVGSTLALQPWNAVKLARFVKELKPVRKILTEFLIVLTKEVGSV
jgi:nucleoside phosphorylase